MNLQLEKQNLIDRLKEIEDETLILKVKRIMDDAHRSSELLEASIVRGLQQSKSGEVIPHEQVMKEFRSKYNHDL